MNKIENVITVCILLIFVAACSNSQQATVNPSETASQVGKDSATAPTATAPAPTATAPAPTATVPNQTVTQTPTPIQTSTTSTGLDPSIIFQPGDFPGDGWHMKGGDKDNNDVGGEISRPDDHTWAYVIIYLKDSAAQVESAFTTISAANNGFVEQNILLGVGEKASYWDFPINPVLAEKHYQVYFTRCNALVFVDEYDPDFDTLVSYLKRLDKRLAPLVCN